MGDREKASLRPQFNPQIRLELHGATITSDAGWLLGKGACVIGVVVAGQAAGSTVLAAGTRLRILRPVRLSWR